MSAESVVIYEVEGAIARVTLNRPEKRNALNDELVAGLKSALRRAHDDDEIRVDGWVDETKQLLNLPLCECEPRPCCR